MVKTYLKMIEYLKEIIDLSIPKCDYEKITFAEELEYFKEIRDQIDGIESYLEDIKQFVSNNISVLEVQQRIETNKKK